MIKPFFGWPGGKQQGAKYILPFIPTAVDKICSPFLGGGMIELNCACMGIEVQGYDILEPLVNFWQVIIEDPQQVKYKILELSPIDDFNRGITDIKSWVYDDVLDPVTRAAAFLISVQCSFGSMPHRNFFKYPRCENLFKPTILNKRFRQPKIRNMSVGLQDFRETIPAVKDDVLLYLDPPYYGHEMIYSNSLLFNHAELASLLRDKKYWILSYNGCNEIRELYKGYKYIDLSGMIAYTLRPKKNSRKNSEILIFSDGYAEEWSDVLVINCAERL